MKTWARIATELAVARACQRSCEMELCTTNPDPITVKLYRTWQTEEQQLIREMEER